MNINMITWFQYPKLIRIFLRWPDWWMKRILRLFSKTMPQDTFYWITLYSNKTLSPTILTAYITHAAAAFHRG